MTADLPRLEIRNLTRSFAGRTVVDDVSFQVMAGQVTCLLGPSGCGKSTTLRMIAGVERQDCGAVLVDGAPISDAAQHTPPEQRGIGLMFQDFSLFPHLSVADNVAFGLRDMAKPARRARAEALLARVDLARFADAFPHQLSGGEQQRVALVRALAPRPRIMLMDEPFSGLDNRLRDGIRDQTLAILKEEGTAVLLVTHEPGEAMRMADDIALMRAGKLVQHGTPLALYTKPVDRAALAFFSDVNLLPATVSQGAAQTVFGVVPTPGLKEGARVEVAFRPEHLCIERAGTAPEGAIPATVIRARLTGSESLIDCKLGESGAALKAVVPGVCLPAAGEVVHLTLPSAHCHVFPMEEET
ncbi:MAG: ABC transporter ATP-binding protein [Pseudomonadota bacterium]